MDALWRSDASGWLALSALWLSGSLWLAPDARGAGALSRSGSGWLEDQTRSGHGSRRSLVSLSRWLRICQTLAGLKRSRHWLETLAGDGGWHSIFERRLRRDSQSLSLVNFHTPVNFPNFHVPYLNFHVWVCVACKKCVHSPHHVSTQV
jgi:hypothetical protein